MLVTVALAVVFPGFGLADGPLRLGVVTQFGIALIFFLHGAKLDSRTLVSGVGNLKAHALIQSTTFLLFPLFGLIVYFAFGSLLPPPLLLGFFFLTALPSTISSSVAMTALGKGNVTLAVFNATLSGLLGLILTPALVSIVSASNMGEFSFMESVVDIAMTLLVPFALGQLSRPLIKGFVAKYGKWVGLVDRGVILLIIFTAFAQSTAGGVWSQFGLGQLIITLGFVSALLALVLVLTTRLAKRLGLPLDEEVAVVFCGSTKSLANGAPIAQILFAGSPILGAILLPLMIYHQLQLIVLAILAHRYETRLGLKGVSAD